MTEYGAVTEKDLPRLLELYARYLNDGPGLWDGIRTAWERGEYFGSKAERDGEIVGVFTMRHGLVFTFPHPELEAEVRTAALGRNLYTSDALIVLPEYRDHGIAHQLVNNTIQQLRTRTPGVVMTEIWIYPDGRCPAREPLETMGRIFYRKKVPLFYQNLSRYGITCPICGKDCVCGAWVDLAEVWGEDL